MYAGSWLKVELQSSQQACAKTLPLPKRSVSVSQDMIQNMSLGGNRKCAPAQTGSCCSALRGLYKLSFRDHGCRVNHLNTNHVLE